MSTRIKSEYEWEAEGLGLAGMQLVESGETQLGDLRVGSDGIRWRITSNPGDPIPDQFIRTYRKIPIHKQGDLGKRNEALDNLAAQAQELDMGYGKAKTYDYGPQESNSAALPHQSSALDGFYDDCVKAGFNPDKASALISAGAEVGNAAFALANESKIRKERPVCSGVLDYFPDALLAVAHCSFVGNEQHNPGSPLHWDRTKSKDQSDALVRHLMQRGTIDSDGVRHSAKVAWRALALLQLEIEQDKK